jgi:hypothetical protein
MADDTTESTDGLRTLRRGSLMRRAWCDADLPSELIEIMLRGDPDRVLFSSNPLQIKDRCVVARYEGPSGPLLVKRHAWGGVRRTLRMAFREPAARRCARLGEFLHARGIPTPRPRAYVDCRLGPWTYRSYLVSDYVEGESLYRYIRFGRQPADELRHVAGQVARIWEKLVERGVSHNDFKPENFIVDSNFDVWLIDLEKVRLRGNPGRQRQRQVLDVKNFLHVRSWHRRLEARAIFAEAFLQTPYREWLPAGGLDRAATISLSGDTPIDPELSVLILCKDGIEMPHARRAIESVRDIADEVVLVEAAESDRLQVLKRLDVTGGTPAHQMAGKKALAIAPPTPVARYPWVLVLQQEECVTPFLAKELQQRIADERAGDKFRIPIEKRYFGSSIARRKSEIAPIRLFRQSAYRFPSAGALLSIASDAEHMAQLAGTIQRCECATVAEYVDRLNEDTTRAAHCRLQQGDWPRFGGSTWRAACEFIRLYFRSGGILSGWIGLQLAVLKAGFCWVEETKLRQMSAEFFMPDSVAASDEDLSSTLPTQYSSLITNSRQAKAA